MKGFAMLGMGKTGWIEKARPVCGALDAIVRPIAVSPCTSDVHTVWEGALGERKDLILGHEAVGEVVEVGSLVRDFVPGDRVIVTAITPDWGSEEAQRGFAMHSGGMLAGWKFSNYKDGVFAEFFHVNEADANLAKLPDDLDPGTACMLCDMMPTGFHAAELAEIGFGESVCVIGIGPVGLMAVRERRDRRARGTGKQLYLRRERRRAERYPRELLRAQCVSQQSAHQAGSRYAGQRHGADRLRAARAVYVAARRRKLASPRPLFRPQGSAVLPAGKAAGEPRLSRPRGIRPQMSDERRFGGLLLVRPHHPAVREGNLEDLRLQSPGRCPGLLWDSGKEQDHGF